MRFSYLIFLAYRNILRHKMRTILTAGGVAVSVGFVVFLISFGMGLQIISTDQVTNIDALQVLDVSVSKAKALVINDDTLVKFNELGNVSEVYPQISSATNIIYGTSEIDGIVYGKDTGFLGLEDIRLSSGRMYNNNATNEAIVNLAAQTQFGSADMLDKNIELNVIVRSELLSKDEKAKEFRQTFKVVGIVNDKSAPFVYVPMKTFIDNGVVNYSGAKIKMNDKEDVAQAKLQVASMGFKVSSIKETLDQINQFFNIFQIVLLAFGSIAIFVACLGMFNTLTVSLIEKTREVGFTKALGTVSRDIYWLFTLESVLIGTLGSVIGLSTGFGLGQLLNYLLMNLARATGNKPVELFYMPLYIFFVILGASIFISFLTGIYPARRASKISPLNAMRYE